MALVAMTPSDTIKYVSDSDPAKKYVDKPRDPADPSKGTEKVEQIDWENATVFHLRALDVILMGSIYDSASVMSGRQGVEEIGIHTRVNKTNIDAVKHGLTSIDNFRDAHGEAVRVKTVKEVVNGREYQVVHTDVLNALGLRLIGELANKIKTISEVSKELEKNSAGASSQSA